MLLSLLGCSDNAEEPIIDEGDGSATVVEFTDADVALAKQLSKFNIDFFKAVNEVSAPDENVVVSPLSASLLLSMLANVSDENTSAEIAKAIGTDNVAGLNELSAKYLTILPKVDKTTAMNFANSLWYQKDYTLNPVFDSVLGEYYSADTLARQLQTNDPTVVAEINNWVSDKTEKLIDKIIDYLDPQAYTVMVNALYFKGAWANPFEADETEKKEFNGVSGTTTVDMMHKLGLQHYRIADKYSTVMMEFGKGSFEAIMLLPDSDVTLDEILNSEVLYELGEMRFTDDMVDFSFPKFKAEPAKLNLDDALSSMGITTIGNWQDYSVFTTPVNAFSSIFQKSTIEFKEKGAEGASVTWGQMVGTAGPDGGEVVIPEINFNRPFMFFVRETTTGAMLFAGKIVNL